MRVLVAILAFVFVSSTGFGKDLGPKPPGQFDYYLLTLTWAPSFCATHSDPQECGHDLGFALHGLWPEMVGGDYPTGCSKVALTDETRKQFQSIYASPSLIDHEWSTHGTCSGLAPADYFALSKADVAAIVIPPAYRTATTLAAADSDAVRQAFMAANPTLAADDFFVTTGNGRVTDVRFCVTKDDVFRSCSKQ